MQEKLRILKNLPGVNKEIFNIFTQKHLVAIECIDVNELIEVISIYDEHGISYVKDSGVVDIQRLVCTKEEALKLANENNNVISFEDFYNKTQGRTA